MRTKTYTEIPDERKKREKNKKREENMRIQTSRLENPEELQLNHSHEKFLFLTVLLLFVKQKIHYL
jgi:hypothetical protein